MNIFHSSDCLKANRYRVELSWHGVAQGSSCTSPQLRARVLGISSQLKANVIKCCHRWMNKRITLQHQFTTVYVNRRECILAFSSLVGDICVVRQAAYLYTHCSVQLTDYHAIFRTVWMFCSSSFNSLSCNQLMYVAACDCLCAVDAEMSQFVGDCALPFRQRFCHVVEMQILRAASAAWYYDRIEPAGRKSMTPETIEWCNLRSMICISF